jgi:hypothetical protein
VIVLKILPSLRQIVPSTLLLNVLVMEVVVVVAPPTLLSMLHPSLAHPTIVLFVVFPCTTISTLALGGLTIALMLLMMLLPQHAPRLMSTLTLLLFRLIFLS